MWMRLFHWRMLKTERFMRSPYFRKVLLRLSRWFVHRTAKVGFLPLVFLANFLDCYKLSDVNFENCNLTSTDICSLWAKNCQFQNVDFSNATISDSTFIQCTFDKSIFNSVSLTRCQFIDCSFEQFPIDDSTFSLNTFTRCQIKNTNLTLKRSTTQWSRSKLLL